VEKLAAALAQSQCGVWWDALIEGGESFARRIEVALDGADVVVVCWSATAIGSDWVRDEAAHGRDSGQLVPLTLDGTLPPLGFRQYHCIDFSKWSGSTSASEIKTLISAITAVGLGEAPQPATQPSPRRLRLSRRRVLAASFTGVGVTLAGTYFGSRLFIGKGTDNSIAVLPLANLSGNPAQSYFSDGLSEDLRARLGQSGQLHVAAQASSNLFRDRRSDAKSAAAQLGVAFLVDGSVRRAGDTLRIVCELIEARTGLSRWSDSFDRQVTDIFAVQAEIAGQVSKAILGKLAPATEAALESTPGTRSVKAYDLYLKGREQYDLDVDEGSDRKAVAYFDQAIAEDPDYANAYAARSAALAIIAGNYIAPALQKPIYDQALADGHKAASLAPNLAEAQYAIGNAINFGQFDFRAAQRFYDRARALGTNNALILEQYGYFASAQGRNTDAISAIDQAVLLDPLNPLMVRAKGKILLAAGQLDEAISLLRKTLVMNPKLQNTSSSIGIALLLQNKFDLARKAFLAEPKESQRLTGLAIVEAKSGQLPAAKAALGELIAKHGDLVLYQQAEIAAQWGNLDRAIALLNRAFTANDSGLTLALNDPMLRPLAGTAGYLAILSKLGLR
jgi:TolB-like protein/Tfp pilus assembly protein PilF